MAASSATKQFSAHAFTSENKLCPILSRFVRDRRALLYKLLDKSKFYRFSELQDDRLVFSDQFERKKILKNMDLINRFLHCMECYFFYLENYDWVNCVAHLDGRDMHQIIWVFNHEIEQFHIVFSQLAIWLNEAKDMVALSSRLNLSHMYDDTKYIELMPQQKSPFSFRQRCMSYP